MKAALVVFAMTFAQNASFTLVSRARNSSSLGYHAVASIASNGIFLLVLRQLVHSNVDSIALGLAYVAGSTVGSVAMHVVAMRWFERHPLRQPATAAPAETATASRLARPLPLGMPRPPAPGRRRDGL